MAEVIDAHIPYPSKPYTNVPDRIVIHAMGEHIKDGDEYLHAVDFLRKYKLSVHKLFAPNGDIFVCRFDHERASHARGFNTNSLGYEFLVEGKHDYGSFVDRIKVPYLTNLQMESGVMVTKETLQLHSINSIDRHSDLSPGRKVDPGAGFPWDYFNRSL